MTWDDGTAYVEELAPGVHAFVQPDGGWMVNNCGLVVDPDGASVLVDTTSTEARNRALLAAARERAGAAPRAVVNTHHHPDHTYGNGFLPAETRVVGHQRCREEVLAAGLEATRVITEPDYGELVVRPPDVTFGDAMTLHLSDRAVELRHVGRPAHTTNDVVVWVPEQGVLFAGDLAFNGGQPFVLEGSLTGFRETLAWLRAFGPEVLVPGHGPVCRGGAVDRLLGAMDDYLALVEGVAGEAHAAGLTPLEAARHHRDHAFSHWAETERFVGNLHRAYLEIEHGTQPWRRLGVGEVWPDMVAFHGGPIGCHA
ncbi:MBL fold metallo-hydrolase [Nocardioides flavescens]|uniref:MBL fold metallo-hydrolase n=1 Tax=Nocardioides flavescens TaxID=2691959 RepID=A0A6L7ERX3_9ACTN|nr:MBL fold metallo-hydrolase [Nocardioides flavescens]MXG88296.1 MBL fold metallo-hydrolase [Nocardioides flavescens]